jgi:V-type H+-transporting ATPase S1 subunit
MRSILLVIIAAGTILGLGIVESAKTDKNSTSISTDGGCRLYIGDIKLSKSGAKGTKATMVYIDGVNLVNDTSTPDLPCGNYSGTILLTYSNIPYLNDNTKLALESFSLEFDIIYQPQYKWWKMGGITMDAAGDLIGDQPIKVNWTGAVLDSLDIGASYYFNYACSKPNALMYSEDRENQPIYTLQFLNFQLQPFKYSSKNKKDEFTDNVDDCVAFFSAGVWMALLTLLLFILIILSGVIMLSNMTTVNRFEDPRAKQLVIIPKD